MTTATESPPRSINWRGHDAWRFDNGPGKRSVYCIDCEQTSPDWWEVRRGLPTASEFDRIITPARWEPSAGAKGYVAQLVGESLSLDPPVFCERGNAAMRHGKETEDEARKWYMVERGAAVRQTGFAVTNLGEPGKNRFAGCSPDGLIEGGDDGPGCLELKCPQPKTHAGYLLHAADHPDDPLPLKYRPQVHGQLIVLGVGWVDFMSYARGMPGLLVRVRPDGFTDLLREYLTKFCDDLATARAVVEGKAEVS